MQKLGGGGGGGGNNARSTFTARTYTTTITQRRNEKRTHADDLLSDVGHRGRCRLLGRCSAALLPGAAGGRRCPWRRAAAVTAAVRSSTTTTTTAPPPAPHPRPGPREAASCGTKTYAYALIWPSSCAAQVPRIRQMRMPPAGKKALPSSESFLCAAAYSRKKAEASEA